MARAGALVQKRVLGSAEAWAEKRARGWGALWAASCCFHRRRQCFLPLGLLLDLCPGLEDQQEADA